MDAIEVIVDLAAESAEVDALVAELPPARWATATPAPGWTIAHQVAHLAWTDQAAALAIEDPHSFNGQLEAAAGEPESLVDRSTEEFLDEPQRLLTRWRNGRAHLAELLVRVPPGVRVPWYGTAMSAASMATARIMETWAHGLDIADALGVTRAPTARLRHIAHLGHRTLGYAFMVHGLEMPTEPVRLELAAPDGTQWNYGPEGAANLVRGTALDFCLLVTQRRHRDDLALKVVGPVADAWLNVAQAFAGPPGAGREAAGAKG